MEHVSTICSSWAPPCPLSPSSNICIRRIPGSKPRPTRHVNLTTMLKLSPTLFRNFPPFLHFYQALQRQHTQDIAFMCSLILALCARLTPELFKQPDNNYITFIRQWWSGYNRCSCSWCCSCSCSYCSYSYSWSWSYSCSCSYSCFSPSNFNFSCSYSLTYTTRYKSLSEQ